MVLTATPAVDITAHNVEMTLMDLSLQFHTAGGAIDLRLTKPQAIELRGELSRFPGFKLDSATDPVILGEVFGGTTQSGRCARPISDLCQPDCQVGGLTIALNGNRLLLKKGDQTSFVQLVSLQRDQIEAEIRDL